MASKNTVTLTFAGDSSDLEKATDRVGKSSEDMADKVDKSSRDVEGSFDRAAEGFDTVDTRAMGFRDTVTGVQDGVGGFSKLLKGDFSAEALVLAGTGVGDLASGFTNFLVPGLKDAWTWLGKTKVGMLAHAATTKVVGAATKVWTGIQAAFNFVMALNPIVLVVIAVVALIAVIIIAYKRSETFRRIVDGAFRWVLKVVKIVWNWIRDNWKLLLGIITGPIGLAVFLISRHWGSIRRGASAVLRWIRAGFRGVTNAVTWPFRAAARAASSAFRSIRSWWNSTVGGRGFTIPDWVPVVGGRSFRIPRFHTGGVMPGAPGTEGLALLQAGERVTPAGAGAANVTVVVESGRGSSAEQAMASMFLHLVRTGALTLSVRQGRVVVA